MTRTSPPAPRALYDVDYRDAESARIVGAFSTSSPPQRDFRS
jgi:hypothetical protein